MKLDIDDRFPRELPVDPETGPQRRIVRRAVCSRVTPRVPTAPQLVHVAHDVAEMIGIPIAETTTAEFLATFSGAQVPAEADPWSMCYGGHQFGSWAGQLGDGRAINLAEVVQNESHYTLQLKGAGETPYSRTADGLAVLRSSLREHICSEAMHHLGVPTTRSLCLITTGDSVMRDVMYDGNPEWEPGAVICRVSPSFVRFGSFEIFASRREHDVLQALADYVIRHHYPDAGTGRDGYVNFFHDICQRTRSLIIHWQRVGFVHGVMNTDNMSILGETIDYGPYGWLEGYEPGWTPNTTDSEGRRYCYGNQPRIALWNLLQLANALYPLIEDASPLEAILREWMPEFESQHHQMLADKLGLGQFQADDEPLLDALLENLQRTETDMTLFFGELAEVDAETPVTPTLGVPEPIAQAFYMSEEVSSVTSEHWRDWFAAYWNRLAETGRDTQARQRQMQAANPRYVFRNYMAQLAIDAAAKNDTSVLEAMYEALRRPYEKQAGAEPWYARRPEWARHRVGCSMLSCSS